MLLIENNAHMCNKRYKILIYYLIIWCKQLRLACFYLFFVIFKVLNYYILQYFTCFLVYNNGKGIMLIFTQKLNDVCFYLICPCEKTLRCPDTVFGRLDFLRADGGIGQSAKKLLSPSLSTKGAGRVAVVCANKFPR